MGNFDALFIDPSNEQPEIKSGTITCGDYTQEEFEEGMEWIRAGEGRDESST